MEKLSHISLFLILLTSIFNCFGQAGETSRYSRFNPLKYSNYLRVPRPKLPGFRTLNPLNFIYSYRNAKSSQTIEKGDTEASKNLDIPNYNNLRIAKTEEEVLSILAYREDMVNSCEINMQYLNIWDQVFLLQNWPNCFFGLLEKNKISTDYVDPQSGKTLLHVAIMYNALEAASWLLSNTSPNLYKRDLFGETPITIAFKIKDIDMINLLAGYDDLIYDKLLAFEEDLANKNNANILKDPQLSDFASIFNLFRYLDRDNIFALLKEYIPKRHEELVVIFSKNPDIFLMLLHTNKIDINTTNRMGQSLLHKTIRNNLTKMAIFLIEQGIDINIEDNFGLTALDRALISQNEQVINLLNSKQAISKLEEVLNDNKFANHLDFYTAYFYQEAEIDYEDIFPKCSLEVDNFNLYDQFDNFTTIEKFKELESSIPEGLTEQEIAELKRFSFGITLMEKIRNSLIDAENSSKADPIDHANPADTNQLPDNSLNNMDEEPEKLLEENLNYLTAETDPELNLNTEEANIAQRRNCVIQ